MPWKARLEFIRHVLRESIEGDCHDLYARNVASAPDDCGVLSAQRLAHLYEDEPEQNTPKTGGAYAAPPADASAAPAPAPAPAPHPAV